jgi:hypothetical protein
MGRIVVGSVFSGGEESRTDVAGNGEYMKGFGRSEMACG